MKAEYDEACKAAEAECDLICRIANEECNDMLQPIWDIKEDALSNAKAEYDKIYDNAKVEYDKIFKSKNLSYEEIKDTQLKHDAICNIVGHNYHAIINRIDDKYTEMSNFIESECIRACQAAYSEYYDIRRHVHLLYLIEKEKVVSDSDNNAPFLPYLQLFGILAKDENKKGKI